MFLSEEDSKGGNGARRCEGRLVLGLCGRRPEKMETNVCFLHDWLVTGTGTNVRTSGCALVVLDVDSAFLLYHGGFQLPCVRSSEPMVRALVVVSLCKKLER